MNKGLVVMIRELSGYGDTAEIYKEIEGKVIKNAEFKNDSLYLTFDNGKVRLFDNGQSCCERRYITCDDSACFLVGNKFTGIKLKMAPNKEDEYGEHEIMFVEVETSGGSIILETHNEHNGYYGGFSIELERCK